MTLNSGHESGSLEMLTKWLKTLGWKVFRMKTAEFRSLVAAAQARYDAMTPEQKVTHDYNQRRSFVRGMCPSKSNYEEYCKAVDRLLPPLTAAKGHGL